VTAAYRGAISAEKNRRFFEAHAGLPIARLLITSGGGEVEAAVELAEWVFAHGIDVEVEDYCLSSCANYVFPAARARRIREGAVVAWHGNYTHLLQTGLWRDDIAPRAERTGEDKATAEAEVKGLTDRLAALERAFFEKIGVDQYLCWIGKMPPYSVPNYYFLSVEDMARFGVTRVTAPPGYGETDVSGFAADIRFVRLRP